MDENKITWSPWIPEYVTYENYRNPHITIHKNGCHQIAKNGGGGEGKYMGFSNYNDAHGYAESLNLSIIDCSFCNPTLR